MLAPLRQIAAVTLTNLRSLPARAGTSLVVVIGIGGVVAVLVALLAMAEGFRATLASTGRPDRVIVLRGGANDELSSVIMREQAPLILDAPGVQRSPEGQPLGIGELYLLTNVPRPGSTGPNNVVVRGTSTDALALRDEVRIVEGRLFTPGRREVIVGRGVQREFGVRLGGEVEVRDGPWRIVGIFEAQGNVHESELWVDADVLRAASRRQAYNSVTVQLQSADHYARFKDALDRDPRLTVTVLPEPEYYASRSRGLNAAITILGYTVALIMGIGALFGALNTMYAAVATRTIEIATLRAIGFGAAPVVASVLLEALVLSALGGSIGGLLAWAFFDGHTVSTLNVQTFSQVAFAFRVTFPLLFEGVLWALGIGLLGGLFPALRAARLPVAEALRAG